MSELERIKIAVKTLISLGIGKNQEEIGTLMGYKSKSSFSQILTNKVPIPSGFVDKLCKLDNRLEKKWIISGEGNILGNIDNPKQVYKDEKQNEIDYFKEKGIPLIPVDAMAGYGAGDVQVMEYEAERFIVPTFKGSDYLISVRGSSMYPKYNSGDIVACKHLPLDTFFQWNKVYVLDTIQGVIIKRVCKAIKEEYVTIVSDNKSYDPFELHRSDIRSIAIVIGVIRLE
ncbi:S24 family peptidase [Flavobacterium sp. XS2P24]|uniref:S24 family peptidase n=1 Tax=Flavobacterium sp. XS2P24 TaxID=3041249 RepID=UPI0024A94A98|nr:S24 family peptidase [Flavobacterium sp. XS2P24]MDI6049574.1 S24 family peptidase [Flavobacterium sp. XS2P24]